jgi:hypothetical protein
MSFPYVNSSCLHFLISSTLHFLNSSCPQQLMSSTLHVLKSLYRKHLILSTPHLCCSTSLAVYYESTNFVIITFFVLLGMSQGSFFLPVPSELGMDVKSVSHLYKESQSLDIVRALIQGITLLKQKQAKVQREQKWTRKFSISVCAAKIAGTILSSTEPTIGNITVVEPPLVIHDTQPQDPQPPQSPLRAPSGDLDLPLQPHPNVEPGSQPPQVEPIPTQADTVSKVLAIQ